MILSLNRLFDFIFYFILGLVYQEYPNLFFVKYEKPYRIATIPLTSREAKGSNNDTNNDSLNFVNNICCIEYVD